MSFGQTAELLARIQFAFTMSFHFIFPAFSIGLASYLAVLEALWLWRRDAAYLKLFDYWKTIFAIVFGMGVVSGIVISYQFGTNWARFSDKAGPVIGPLMGYEVLTAFFLEAGFLGIMLFGRKRVGPGLHCSPRRWSAVGTLISATWIISANSLDADAGRLCDQRRGPVRAGRLVGDHLQSELSRTAWSTWCWRRSSPRPSWSARSVPCHLLRDRANRQARIMFSMAMWMAAIVTPLQIVAGDQQGLNTLEHQPAKIAAIEGHYDTTHDDAADPVRHPRRQRRGDDAMRIEIPNLGGAHPHP